MRASRASEQAIDEQASRQASEQAGKRASHGRTVPPLLGRCASQATGDAITISSTMRDGNRGHRAAATVIRVRLSRPAGEVGPGSLAGE